MWYILGVDNTVAVMYKLIACVLILSALIQESVQDGDCPDCPVCGAPTADAEITSTFAGSLSKTRRRRQASMNPEPGKSWILSVRELCMLSCDGLVLNVIYM